MPTTVLGGLLAAEVVFLAVLTLTAVAVLGGRRWETRYVGAVRDAQDRVLRLLAGDGDRPAALDAVAALPVRHRRRLVLGLVAAVGPADRPLLADLAAATGLVDGARRQLRSRWWRRRLAGVQLLTAIGVDDGRRAVLLDDPVPAVRAAAAWWSSTVAAPVCAPELAARAEDPSGRVRHALAESLARCGPDGAGVVADLMVTGSDRARRVAVLAAAGLHDPRVEAAARTLAAAPDPGLRTAACRLLSSADPATVAVLDGLVVDPDPGVRAAAAAALGAGRMGVLVDRLAPLVADDDDVVRVAAAEALVQLGPVGEMVVRVNASTGTRSLTGDPVP